ncbi:putative transglutaminase elicitor [Plasmopara halstedii]
MRTSSLISTTFALATIHVRGSPSTSTRRLEAIPEYEESVLIEMEQHFGQKLERKLTNLPTWGASDIKPWYGPAWGMWADSINYVETNGDFAPSAKYAMAFGLNVDEFMDKVSAKFGIDSVKDKSSTCTSYCEGHDNDCAIRKNSQVRYCVSRWSSISEGVAQASLLEKEPRCPVTFNNVTFNPNDIKGLISVVYAEAQVPTIYGGNYFPGQNGTLDGSVPSAPPQYRNVNPAFYHITAANLLGKLNQSFIFDRYSDERVLDLTAFAFEVTRLQRMTLQEAAREFFDSTSYTFNDKATEVVYVASTLYFVDSKVNDYPSLPYTYILELDSTGDCIGGQWLEYQPDAILIPKEKPAADLVTGIGISYANALMLLDKSAACSN